MPPPAATAVFGPVAFTHTKWQAVAFSPGKTASSGIRVAAGISREAVLVGLMAVLAQYTSQHIAQNIARRLEQSDQTYVPPLRGIVRVVQHKEPSLKQKESQSLPPPRAKAQTKIKVPHIPRYTPWANIDLGRVAILRSAYRAVGADERKKVFFPCTCSHRHTTSTPPRPYTHHCYTQ
jgi:hypothetical protein